MSLAWLDPMSSRARTTSSINKLLKPVYLPRPEMPLSSLGSKDEEEEERCENAELRSEAVWTGFVVVAAAGTGGCGLHRPVRLSKGTGVIDAVVTSLVLTWGFTWFLLQRRKMWRWGSSIPWEYSYHILVTSVSCSAPCLRKLFWTLWWCCNGHSNVFVFVFCTANASNDFRWLSNF